MTRAVVGRLLTVGLVPAAMLACGQAPEPTSTSPLGHTELERFEAAPPVQDTWGRLSARERALQLRREQAAAGSQHAVRRTSAGLQAKHPGMSFQTSFTPARVAFRPSNHTPGQSELNLAASDWGCREAMRALPKTAPVLDPASETRVSYRHPEGLEEWYVHGPAGLEQGFTIDRLPVCAAASELRISLASSSGWRANASAQGDQAVFSGPGGARVLYGHLFAEDATGRELALRVEGGDAAALVVDARGAKLPISIDPLAWEQVQKLTPNVAGDTLFGRQMAMGGDTLLVNSAVGTYFYVRSGTSFVEQQRVTGYGGSVADLDGDTAILGNYSVDSGQGAAWVLVRSGSTWTQQAKLVAPSRSTWDYYGSAVAVRGDTAIVGAPSLSNGHASTVMGAAHVYLRSGTTWSLQKSLVGSDSALGDAFGTAVAISGNTAVIGAFRDDVLTTNDGSAYVFTRSGTVWTQQQKLSVAGASQFGGTAEIVGDTTLIGGGNNSYAFDRTSSVWGAPQVLGSNNVYSMTAALAATNDFLYAKSGNTWSLAQQLKSLDAPGYVSRTVNNGTYAVASDDGQGPSGAAYVFTYGTANGTACTLGSDCVTGNCVEGVCCSTPCNGLCQSCKASLKATGLDGTCGPTKAGDDPGNECTQEAASTCGKNGFCDGAGACALYAASTVCEAASCPTPTSANPDNTCNGTGTCLVTPAAACSVGYACVAGACKTTCTDNADCDEASDYICVLGACKIKRGAACDDAAECEDGFCADGVCCDTDCEGKCRACVQNFTDKPDGTCSPIPAGQDRDGDECPIDPGFPGSCQEDGTCDGAGSCRLYAIATTPCGETTCEDGAVSGELCDGFGNCDTDTAQCEPYVCNGAECGTECDDDSQCDAGAYCLPGGTCAKKSLDGEACLAKNECDSGFCVDGVCCESACNAKCSACGEKGTEGSCVAVVGAPRGERPACDGDPEACGGECDGVDPADCRYAPPTKTCSQSCAAGKETVGSCDGAGTCSPGQPRPCGAYVCGDDACLTSCSSPDDCASGYACQDDACEPSRQECSDDLSQSLETGQDPVDCAPFVCDPSSGVCRTRCGDSTECAGGKLCDTAAGTCEEATQTSAEDSGCGCRAAGRPSREWGWLLLSGLVIARLRSRRARAASH